MREVKYVPRADERSASMGWFFDPGFIQSVQRVAADVENPSMESIDSVLFALSQMGYIVTGPDHLFASAPDLLAALEKLPQWRTDAPPRDRVFLARVGYPFVVMCHYSPLDNDFVWAMVQVNVVDGEWNDYYFETEHSPESEITGWMEVPK